MGWNLSDSITVIWIGITVFTLLVYWGIFQLFYGILLAIFKRTAAEKESQNLEETVVPTAPPGAGASGAEDSSALFDCRFSDASMQEYQYNDVVGKAFYLLGFDSNYVRTATIRADAKDNQTHLACSIGAIESGKVPHELITSHHAVPIQYLTHLQYYAFSSNLPIWWRLWHAIKYWLSKLHANLILVPTILMFVALVICFYVPTYFLDNSKIDHEGAKPGYNATVAITVLTVLTVFFHILVIILTCKDSQSNRVAAWSLSFALLPLVIAVCLVLYLNSLAQDDNAGSSGGDSNWDKFTCSCPSSDNDDYGPADDDPAAPTADGQYSFVCSINSVLAASSICDLNCGVCGDKYRNPFIAYTVFGTIYEIIVLFFVFVHFLIAYLYAYYVVPYYAPTQTGMELVLHGSRSFGYPLVTRLSVKDAIRAERQLNALRKDLENNEARRGKEFLKHITTAGSSQTLPSTSVVSQVQDVMGQAIKAVFTVLRMLGVA